MKVTFSNNVQRSSSRLQVGVQAAGASDSPGVHLQVAAPKTLATFGRRVCNLLTLGWYTKHRENPAQWRAFRNAITADLQQSGHSTTPQEAEGTALRLLAGYSPHKRLTAAKVNNAMLDLARLKSGDSPWAADPQRANASQAGVARLLNTVRERNRALNADESRLHHHAHEVIAREQPLSDADLAGVMSFGDGDSQDGELASRVGDSVVSQAQFEQLGVPELPKHAVEDTDAARAILSILRPGRAIDGMALEKSMVALERYAQAKPVSFAALAQLFFQPEIGQRVNQAIEHLTAAQEESLVPDLLAVPFGLAAPPYSLLENHSVLIAVDTRHQKVMYLDAKGHPLELAMKNYANARDLKAQLERLGKAVFGQDWSAGTGVLQLTQAKQQGANDCVAFTHGFARRLIDGQSVGDIERTMTAADRRSLRLDMAQDIDHFLLGGPPPQVRI